MSRFTYSMALSVVVAFLSAGGCSETVYDDDRHRDDDGWTRDDWKRDRYPDRDDRSGVPREARIGDEGRGIIRYRVPTDGRVYLYDADDRRVIATRDIRRGREFIVSPKDDRAWIDDDRVVEYNFDRDHTHRIYFLPERERYGSGDDRRDRYDPYDRYSAPRGW